MNKEWFNIKTDNIEVPEDELFLAIDKGIEKGRKRKKYKKKTKILLSLTSIAASLFLASGFLFSPIAKVMASMPIIGSFYDAFYDSYNYKMGKQLEDKNLITELNQTASDNGVNITLTSVYYDGMYIGVTFKANGFELDDDMDPNETYEFYLYEKDGLKMGWDGSDGHLKKIDNYYVAAVEMEYPYKQLPKDFTLPIIFEKMGGIEGKWEFEIPVTQVPLKKYEIENRFTQNEKYSFNLESMAIGETNIRIDYTTTLPIDYLKFKIIDDKGNELGFDTLLARDDDFASFETSIGNSKYLLIYPAYYEKENENWKLIELDPLKVNMQDN